MFSRRSILIVTLLVVLPALGGCLSAAGRNDAQVHYMLGVSYLKEPNLPLALKEFQLAAKLNSSDGDIQIALGQTYHTMKAYVDAERHYKRAIDLNDQNPIYQNNLAALYLDMQRWDDAIRFFRQSANNLLFTNPEIALAGIGYAYLQKGEYLTAVSNFKDAIKSNPSYALARQRLAETYEKLGKNDLSVAEYQEVVKLTPADPQAHYRLAMALSKGKQPNRSIASFQEVLRLAPNSEEGRLAQEYIKLLR